MMGRCTKRLMSAELTAVETTPTLPSIGRYRLVMPLDSGIGSEVFAAVVALPEGNRTWVAIKLLSATSDPNTLASEARLASMLDHPLLTRVVDFGVTKIAPGGPPRGWFATPLVLGETLATWMRHADAQSQATPIDPLLAAMTIAHAADALHSAHELADDDGKSLGIVHRDLSPSNLLLAFDGTPRIIDFGIANASLPRVKTATGHVRGTLGYLAPERLDEGVTDRRSDVWGLAVTLWEWIAGRRLYPCSSLRELEVALRRVPALSDHRSDVPLSLEEVLGKALQRDPSRRHPTCRAFARELLDCMADERRAFAPGDLALWLDQLAPGLGARQRRLLTNTARRLPRVDAITAEDVPIQVASSRIAPLASFSLGLAVGSCIGLAIPR